MLAILRCILILLMSIIICIFGIIYCLFFYPRNPNNVEIFGRIFGSMAPILGIKIELRPSKEGQCKTNCIYISNHQNNYDIIIAAYAIQPRTITVGKKSILLIPLFGWLYWISGNFLIDREKKNKAYNSLISVIKYLKKRKISIWIFPEGTRNRGRGLGLLPFKIGAFYAATQSGLKIIPICISNTTNKIKLNRWSNGLVIIEILSPIDTKGLTSKPQVRQLMKHCYDIMRKKINELNLEVISRESKFK